MLGKKQLYRAPPSPPAPDRRGHTQRLVAAGQRRSGPKRGTGRDDVIDQDGLTRRRHSTHDSLPDPHGDRLDDLTTLGTARRAL